MRRLAIVLLSGGLDSTTAATLAQREGYELSALTVRYGQVHQRELESARAVASALGIPHLEADVGFFRDLAWYSALTNPAAYARPADRSPDAMAEAIPITYVPLRNTFFLTLAAAALESRALAAIEQEQTAPADVEATIIIAANAIDYSGYPDCRPEFYRAAMETLRLGSKLGTAYDIPIQVATPLIELSKAEIVRLAQRVAAPLHLTWSCYGPGPAPCGRCDSCLLRAKGFAEAGATDPALAT